MAKEPSLVCIVSGTLSPDLHHIYSKKAWPELKEKPWNLIPINRKYHQEWHSHGACHMAEKYPQIKAWMERNDWAIDLFRKTWSHDRRG